jgi:hypothetical protein
MSANDMAGISLFRNEFPAGVGTRLFVHTTVKDNGFIRVDGWQQIQGCTSVDRWHDFLFDEKLHGSHGR